MVNDINFLNIYRFEFHFNNFIMKIEI